MKGPPIAGAATVFSTRVPKGKLRVSFSALASRRATKECPVEKDETEEGASRESDEMPLLRGERAEKTEA